MDYHADKRHVSLTSTSQIWTRQIIGGGAGKYPVKSGEG